MDASILDLRRNMKKVVAAIGRNERVTLTCRGKKTAVIVPCADEKSAPMSVASHPAFGMWSGRKDIGNVADFTRILRKGRSF
jgi:antitoxin (DNA-binding transcriptional repressor) of toxin-antitoxin stability system